jgi:hypothetical protein
MSSASYPEHVRVALTLQSRVPTRSGWVGSVIGVFLEGLLQFLEK